MLFLFLPIPKKPASPSMPVPSRIKLVGSGVGRITDEILRCAVSGGPAVGYRRVDYKILVEASRSRPQMAASAAAN